MYILIYTILYWSPWRSQYKLTTNKKLNVLLPPCKTVNATLLHSFLSVYRYMSSCRHKVVMWLHTIYIVAIRRETVVIVFGRSVVDELTYQKSGRESRQEFSTRHSKTVEWEEKIHRCFAFRFVKRNKQCK